MAKKKRNWREKPPHCRHCFGEGELVSGREIYPHRPDLFHKQFWLCRKCDAYVGVHDNSEFAAPLGLLATEQHRQLKMRAHALFDRVWRCGSMSRADAYDWLANRLGKDKRVHIGWSTVEELERIIVICKSSEFRGFLGDGTSDEISGA